MARQKPKSEHCRGLLENNLGSDLQWTPIPKKAELVEKITKVIFYMNQSRRQKVLNLYKAIVVIYA